MASKNLKIKLEEKMEELEKKTIMCLRVIKNTVDKRGGFVDGDIYGVMVVRDDKFKKRNGMIVYGPSSSESCQAFILGMTEIMIREQLDDLEFTWVNLRRLLKKLQYYDLFD